MSKKSYCNGWKNTPTDINNCCHQHDKDYGIRGTVSRAEADRRLRECMIKNGHLVKAWVFWLVVRLLDNAKKLQIIEAIEAFKDYKDLHILCSWLAFSGQQVSSFDNLYKRNFWHCVPQNDYPTAEGYLDGVEIVRESFHQLAPCFSGQPDTLLLLDPSYVFFSSTKSEFIRFIDAMVEDKWDNWQVFDNIQRIVVQTSANYNGKYEDNMVYKF